MAGNVIELTDGTFEQEVLKSDLPVLIDFWAPWCGPCWMVGPIVEELAGEYAGKLKVCKMNVDSNTAVATNYNISAIPTLMIFKQGELKERIVGAVPKATLKAALDKHV